MKAAKPPQKIGQVSKHAYNTKKQKSKQMNEQKIAQDGYENMQENAKMQQTKQMHH